MRNPDGFGSTGAGSGRVPVRNLDGSTPTGAGAVPAAAQRALTLVAILWVLEHFVVPLVLMVAFPAVAHTPIPAPVADAASALPESEE